VDLKHCKYCKEEGKAKLQSARFFFKEKFLFRPFSARFLAEKVPVFSYK
jgi:hypothetical protein